MKVKVDEEEKTAAAAARRNEENLKNFCIFTSKIIYLFILFLRIRNVEVNWKLTEQNK